MILLVVFCFGVVHAGLFDYLKHKANDKIMETLGLPINDDCGFTRQDGLICIQKYLDRNHDGEISEAEFAYAQQHFLPERMRKLATLTHKIGLDYTVEKILPKCDANKDGKLSVSDWKASEETCLPTKADLCKLQCICNRAKKLSEK